MDIAKKETGAVLVIAFLCIMGSASAFEYSSCPKSAMVENAYWNYPYTCSGGVYGRGSLNLKWPDAVFSNDTIEVKSVTLVISTRSKGTYMVMQSWNGHSWSNVAGGMIDFLGDYAYDLTYKLGPYTDDSARIRIINSGNEELVIEQLLLNIEYESRLKELTVVVRDCSSNKRLEDVEVEVDDKAVETDGDGEAMFTLAKDRSYTIEVGGEDYTERSTGAYLDDDLEVEICVYKDEQPAVEVTDLEVEDGVIEFYLENTGNVEETIKYYVRVDDYTIFEGYVTLEVGDEERIIGSYDFPPGIHRIRVRAETGGYADADSVTYTVPGETENYACSGHNVVREVITDSGYSSWEVFEVCGETCSEGVCVAFGDTYVPAEYGGYASSACDVEITSLSYPDKVLASELETFGVKVRNDGDSASTVQLKLYVDGAFRDKAGARVGAGDAAESYLQSRLAQGLRLVRIDAVACGYVRDSVSELISVKPRSAITTSLKPAPSPSQPLDSGTTDSTGEDEVPFPAFSVVVEPNEIIAAPCEGVVFRVTIYSAEERSFHIVVTGYDEELADYPDSVTADGYEEAYVFVKAPLEPGEYPGKVRVWSGDDSTERNVRIVVLEGPRGEVSATDGLSGFVTYAQADWMIYALVGIAMAAVFIVLFMRYYMQEQEYDFTSLEYGQNVRKASLQ